MAPIKRSCTNYYSSVTVSIALSCTIFEINGKLVENRNLFIPLAFDVIIRGIPVGIFQFVSV